MLGLRSGRTRPAVAAAICAAGLAIGLGGSALLAQLNEGNPVPNTESTPNNIPCVDEGACTPVPPYSPCGFTLGYCTWGTLQSGPIDAETCTGTAQGVNCTDTGQKACAVYNQGQCEWLDNGVEICNPLFDQGGHPLPISSLNEVDTCTQSGP